ncbi:molybdenum cofactor guanylyltransferase [Fibrella arboris]|uniref:molybdenum cofactor guanylyltransferase n=1 Tax=Fibrella arboris TaxID=3242486 RepID=UPI0035224053
MKAKEVPADNVPAVTATTVYGLVLMGGQSTRMGQDKSALVYHGKPQYEYLTDLLTPLCQTVYWSVNETQRQQLTYTNLLPDRYPETGPLGGLLTAYDTYPDAAWLLVPCDLPNLDEGTLQNLLTSRNKAALATAFWDADRSGPEPLVSLWEPSAGPLLRDWFQAGQRSLRRFLTTHSSTWLDVPDARAFENINDWESYRRYNSRGHTHS